VIGTIFLLAASLAVYDLIVQIATIGNLFGTNNSTGSTPLTAEGSTSGLTWRQIIGQFLFSLILVLIAIAVLWYFKPFGGATQKDLGASRGIRDAELIRGSPIPGLLVLR
jgi:O-antigen/teichoic acid export membrane protein